MFYIELATKIGLIHIVEKNNQLFKIGFGDNDTLATYKKTVFLESVEKQINDYFDGKIYVFTIPIELNNNFYGKVLNYLKTIPYGSVKTYQEVAIAVDSPRAYRAVGKACNKNPFPIIIPCHRVIGSNNRLIGYAGGIEIKKQLLKFENVTNKIIF